MMQLHQAAPGEQEATIVKLLLTALQHLVPVTFTWINLSRPQPVLHPGVSFDRLAASSHGPLRFLRPALWDPQGAVVPRARAPSPTGPQLVDQDVADRPPEGGDDPGGGEPQGVGPLRLLGQSHVEPPELQEVPGQQPAEGRAGRQTLQLAAGLLHERQVAVWQERSLTPR